MFDDDSDEGDGFLKELSKPAAEQKSKILTNAGGGAGPKKKPKSNNPFGSSSDEDGGDYAGVGAKTGYQGAAKK